ncbi:MAG TPA: kelch repeat-containing protein [Terriglobales bacterium]|nr:kelch repeat-containing protein [Terriglobales bacterium]
MIPVAVTPITANVIQGATQPFTANAFVTWSVQEGAAGGTITPAGLYTAPNAAGTYHVVATNSADSRSTGSATVTVPAVGLTLGNSVNVGAGATAQLNNLVMISGTVNTGVTWSLQEGAAGGTITPAGLYTAPMTAGTFHVVVQSVADTHVQGSITVNVQVLAVSISPTSDVLGPIGRRTISASFNGPDPKLTWTIAEGAGSGTLLPDALAAGFSIYIAPTKLGTYHVVATSVSNPNLNATSAITVVPSGFLAASGQMQQGRSAATATLLTDGKVLVAGGDACSFFGYYYYGSCQLDNADLYDPATDSFTPITSKMSTVRVFHTATILQDGKVLVAGGGKSTAELYDPATETFALTGAMLSARSFHSATLLTNGKVLIAGGQGTGGQPLTTAELYDPATATFSATGNMATSRMGHTATLLQDGTVLIAGGRADNAALATAEIFDPVKGTFASVGNMTTERTFHRASLLANGKVLLTGGTTNGAQAKSADIYDPSMQKFTATGNMMVSRDSHVSILLADQTVLVTGGYVTGADDYVAEIYDPATGTFHQTGSMTAGRILAAATVLQDGRVFVVGGSDLSTAELYK